jgi:hypothetical protein
MRIVLQRAENQEARLKCPDSADQFHRSCDRTTDSWILIISLSRA